MVTGKPHKPGRFARLVLYPTVGVLFSFVVVAVLVLANGYRLVYKEGRFNIKKTGMLIVATRPSDGKITINGKQTRHRTGFYLLTTKISSLAPDFYDVEVSREGYRTWKNTVEILPNMVTWINYILLFPEKLNITKIDAPVGTVVANSANGRHALFSSKVENIFKLESLDTNNLSIKNFWTTNQSYVEPWLTSPEIISAKYSPNADRIILDLKNAESHELVVVDATANQPRIIKLNTLGKSFSQAWWNPSSNSEIYLESAGSLYLININDTQLKTPILESAVTVSIEEGRQIFYIMKDATGIHSVNSMGLDGNNKTKIVDSVLPATSYKLGYSSQEDVLAVLNKDTRTLTAFYPGDAGKRQSIVLSTDVLSFGWSKNGQKIYYYGNDFIHRYDWEKEREVLASLDSKPVSVEWYFDDNHYMVRTESGMHIIDYDGSNRVDISEKPASYLITDKTNDNIIFSILEEKDIHSFYKFLPAF